MSFTSEMQQASFRGVPFGMREGEGKFGRRTALHEYPFRDKPWAEDIGRAARIVRVTGFLISDSTIYGGGDVIDQREQMIGACEQSGSGTLVHPSLGELTVSLLAPVSITERWNEGRYYELNFEFVESGNREFPSAADDTSADTDDAADDMDESAGADFSAGLGEFTGEDPSILAMVASTVDSWVDDISPLVSDATSLLSMVGTLSGSFGRYFGGRTTGFASAVTPANPDVTISDLIADGSDERASVQDNIAALQNAVAAGVPANIATAAQAVAASVLSIMVDPADAVRLLSGLSSFAPEQYTSSAPIGIALGKAQTITGDMLRRTTLGALARATALYQPSSQNDAATVLATVVAFLDAEILTAGDDGDDASYSSLRALKVAVCADLTAKGAGLPAMQIFNFNAPLPSLVLASRMYRDVDRADELVTEADPVHPAFMPLSFSALSI